MKKLLLSATVAALAMAASPVSAEIVNLASFDATSPTYTPTPVTQTFGPGTYDIRVIGTADGGQYDTYAIATPPTEPGGAKGNFKADFNYTYNNNTVAVSPYGAQRFTTAAAALAAYAGVVVSSFTLDKTTALSFIIPDTWYYDNTGGLSLGITKGTPASVPEPGTMALFGLAGGALLAARRRKKAANAA